MLIATNTLALLAACLAAGSAARADQALSEVWSEGEGLQLKYLTNHDDLLSTKGSELSLGSSEAPTKAKEAGETSGGEASAEEAPTAEQGADSSRQSERVPASAKQARQRFQEPPAKYRQPQQAAEQATDSSSDEGSSSDANEADERPSRARYPESESSASFGAALEQDERAPSGDELASADPGNEQQQLHQEAPKFRAPGRLFKEAVKMAGGESQQELGEKSSAGESEEAGNQEEEPQSNQQQLQQQQAAGEEAGQQEEPTGAGEPDFAANSNGNSNNNEDDDDQQARSQSSLRARQNMIDFDRLSAGAGRSGSDEPPAATRPRRPTTGPAFYPEQRHYQPQQLASAGSTAASHKAAAGPQLAPASKQLHYFRGVAGSGQGSAAAAGGHAHPANGPDSERDNFISPGHFPGSMPHLTQAASESQPALKAAESSQVPAASSDSSLPQVSASEQEPRIAPAAATTKEPSVAAVTPEPEAQPEAQQIMAPILMSTTTMAPMPAASPEPAATPAAAAANSSSSPATTTSSTTTTATPSLKRFKFRKYR